MSGEGRARLNGWKETARYLGKGVRTIQRWEKLYGLPVHRVGSGLDRSDAVFADRGELDEWARGFALHAGSDVHTADRPPDAGARGLPGRRLISRRRMALALTGMAAIAALWLASRPGSILVGPAPAVPGPPGAWRLAGDALRVRDAGGRLLFEHRFGFEVFPSRSEDDFAGGQPPVQLFDVDGDGRYEVLVALPARLRSNRRFYCFEADGRLRFALQPAGVSRFGSTDYSGPWLAYRAWVTRGTDRRASLWAAFVHAFLFPTRVLRLDPHGVVLDEYWSNGYVVTVEEGRLGGSDLVAFGGVNNESRGASLAVFDRGAVRGQAPAAKADYACATCPAGGPRDFLVFPNSCLLQFASEMAVVRSVSFEPGGRLSVWVDQGRGRPDDIDATDRLLLHYTLGPDLAAAQVEISREFVAVHDALAAAGRLDHRFGPADERALLGLKRFAGSRFVALPARRDRP